MRIAVVQLAYGDDESFEARVDRVAGLVADQAGHDLVVLPELWGATGFDYSRWARPRRSRSTGAWASAMADAARAARVSAARRVVRRAPRRAWPRRQRPREHLTAHRPPTGARSRPTARSTGSASARASRGSWRRGTRSSSTEMPDAAQRHRCGSGLSTCYDLRFPELYRLQLEAGAEMFVVPAAWPAARVGHWTLLGRARAVENQCVVVQCNTAGTHAGTRWAGTARWSRRPARCSPAARPRRRRCCRWRSTSPPPRHTATRSPSWRTAASERLDAWTLPSPSSWGCCPRASS